MESQTRGSYRNVTKPFKEDEIILLLGAGSSVEADIPHSKQMIRKLEELLENSDEWKRYRKLYHFMKSSLLYADGILGEFGNNFDIERLVNILGELEKRETAELYPFIGSWNQRLIELAKYDFEIIRKFKQNILRELCTWVKPSSYSKSSYFQKLYDFQSQYGFVLRVFTLNYDLCVEKNRPEGSPLELGFDSTTDEWDWKRFQRDAAFEPGIYLYKMHGSIDWERDPEQNNVIKKVAHPSNNPDLIFGTNYKMQYVDPYLFYAYEFRKYSLDAAVILVIGYSFRDEHINGILSQALQKDSEKKVVAVSPNVCAEMIQKRLSCKMDQIVPIKQGAKEFFNNSLSIPQLAEIVGRTENDF